MGAASPSGKAGQAVLNGVVMVAYFNQLRNAGATAINAVIKGLLPMALSHEIGSETQKP